MSIKSEAVDVTINDIKLLHQLSIEVLPAEVVALVGPNGAGKSTLLRVLAGDITPTRGNVFYDRQNIANLCILQRAHYRSVMSQSQPMVYDYNVKDIVSMGWLHGDNEVHNKALGLALQETMERCDIDHLDNRRFNTLSGGEQKRVHLARALLQLWLPDTSAQHRYLLLDEPLANLDMTHEINMLGVIKQCAQEGIGVLIVLHDLNLAAKFADKIVLCNQGRVVSQGSPEQVFDSDILTSVYGVTITLSHNPLTISYY
ncbi:MAG: heme ABC transporter ATP-binding protein [Porticoccaceae bacterium]|nr:heme ABC transporter ATP-binding protein [Porticoccaceae bacterium]MDG1475101.1 heme ABC transporter ATP-binding protein [Porticoccaceae bacterium]